MLFLEGLELLGAIARSYDEPLGICPWSGALVVQMVRHADSLGVLDDSGGWAPAGRGGNSRFDATLLPQAAAWQTLDDRNFLDSVGVKARCLCCFGV